MPDHSDAIAAAMKCLDEFMAAFNSRDPESHARTFNFPSMRIASGKMVILNREDFTPKRYQTEALKEWDHSKWDRRNVIHAGADKVHFDTRFTRYRKDGSVISGYDSIYVVTKEDGHWGIKARSSFAP